VCGLATGRSRERGKARSRAIACPAKHSSLAAGVRPATSRLRAYLLHALWEIYKTSKLTLPNAEFFQADVCCSRSRLRILRRLSLQAPGGSRAEGRAPRCRPPQSDKNFTEHLAPFQLKYRNLSREVVCRHVPFRALSTTALLNKRHPNEAGWWNRDIRCNS
jgi:hypothetical protein